MKKPLIRWTVGGHVSDSGLDVLRESVRKTQQVLGKDRFRWCVCHNKMPSERLKQLQPLNAELLEQQWSDLPLPIQENHHLDSEIRNAIWKVCPARLQKETHEIIIDNDLVICNKSKQIDEFLASNSILLLEDPLRFYGQYDPHIPPEMQINTGFIGLPPGYDFAADIRHQWRVTGSLGISGLDDEQGLVVMTLLRAGRRQSIISKNEIIELHPDGLWRSWADAGRGRRYQFTGKETGLHFVEINRNPFHQPWQQYKECRLYKILHQ